jgi:hypothetical protein
MWNPIRAGMALEVTRIERKLAEQEILASEKSFPETAINLIWINRV